MISFFSYRIVQKSILPVSWSNTVKPGNKDPRKQRPLTYEDHTWSEQLLHITCWMTLKGRRPANEDHIFSVQSVVFVFMFHCIPFVDNVLITCKMSKSNIKNQEEAYYKYLSPRLSDLRSLNASCVFFYLLLYRISKTRRWGKSMQVFGRAFSSSDAVLRYISGS